jgi:folate-binding protein YgfZ
MTDPSPAPWFCCIPDLGVLTLQGTDAAKLLQGQTTCDLLGLPPSASTLGAICTPQGRALAVFRAFKTEAAIHLLLPRDMTAAMQKRLRMYVLRADVVIEDATARWACLGLGGPGAEKRMAELGWPAPVEPGAVAVSARGYVIRGGQAGDERWSLLVEADAAANVVTALRERGCAAVDANQWRLADIRFGLPEITAATTDAFVPQMLNLDRLGGIGFSKGCYTGQEIVARAHYLGTLKRRMYRLSGAGDATPQAGNPIFPAESDGQSVGTVIAAAPCGANRVEMLAVLNIQAAKTGELRLHSPGGPILAIASLPYAVADSDSVR